MTDAGGQQPSIRGIFAWANARFGEHWPGLFAIALVPGIIPIARLAITHRKTPASVTATGWALTLVHELLLRSTVRSSSAADQSGRSSMRSAARS